jgi:AmmeMemoRadiSam system protein A
MFQLSDRDQQSLLQIVRHSVRAHLSGQIPLLPDIRSGTLAEPHGIFVSIHKGVELRGCIGNVHPTAALYRTASECAISAAFGDPRFAPMMRDELETVDFEISVLSTMERVEDVRQIEVGKHGLMISKRKARGLLLPQVASAYGWNSEKFLEETCKKAGLPPDEWKDGAAIHRFSAFVFGESRFHLAATP